MATYPFFQKAIADSTPFPGTMAETSTPTPMGTATQTPSTPQPTEAPGDAGNRERSKKIQESIDLIDKQLQFISTMKYNPSNKWSEAIHRGLNGKVTEPVDYTYKKFEAMNDFLKTRASLVEEQRLLLTPNPATQKTTDEAANRKRRKEYIDSIDSSHKAIGLPPVPDEIRYQFIEGGYSLNEAAAKAGGDDEIKRMIGAANAGQEVGPEGVVSLELTGKMGNIAAAGAKYGEKVRTEKSKEEDKGFPVLGLFEKPSQLFQAMHTDLTKTLDDEMYYTIVKTETLDPMGKPMERKTRNAAQLKAARADVASRWPGYEKYFPNFIEKGFTDLPAVEPKQGDVDVSAIRQRLKEKAAAAGKK